MSIFVDNLEALVMSNAAKSDEIIIISGFFSVDIIEKVANYGKKTTFYYGMYLRNGISQANYDAFVDAQPVAQTGSGWETFEILRGNDYLSDYAVFTCPSSITATGSGTNSLKYEGDGTTAALTPNLSYAGNLGMIEGDSQSYGRADSGIAADLAGSKYGAGIAAASAQFSNGGNSNHTNFGNILFQGGHVTGFNGVGWFSGANAGYPVIKTAKVAGTEASDGSTAYIKPNLIRRADTGAVCE